MPENGYQLTELEHAYQVLGVPTDAAEPLIRRAYRQLITRWHPDRYASGTPEHIEATHMASLINEAYAAIALAPLRDYVEAYTVPRSVPENAYKEEWDRYRARRNKLFVVIAVEFLAAITLPFCIGFAEELLGSKPISILVMMGAISWAIVLVSAILLLPRFSCPRCHNNFFGASFGRGPAQSWYRRSCAYCDLPRSD